VIEKTNKTVLERTEEDKLVYKVNDPKEYVEAWYSI
jgi:hypothetical protein